MAAWATHANYIENDFMKILLKIIFADQNKKRTVPGWASITNLSVNCSRTSYRIAPRRLPRKDAIQFLSKLIIWMKF